MSHLVSYKWIRKTQVIPELGLFYNVCGILLGECVVEGSQFFHETRLQFLLSLTPFRIFMKIRTQLKNIFLQELI